MTRFRSLWILLALLWLPGCTPPGKPVPVPNEGLPAKVMDFSTLFADPLRGLPRKGRHARSGPSSQRCAVPSHYS